MGLLGDLFGGPGKVREYGGGFDRAIKPYAEEGFTGLQTAYQAGPRVFEGPRVAGFDPEQEAAQASRLALATAQPDYFQQATAGIGEALGLQRQAASPLTAQALAEQRQLLEPMAEAQRRQLERSRQTALKDIGLAFGDPTQGRAQVAALEATGDYLGKELELEEMLTSQAMRNFEAQKAREAGGAAGLASLFGQQLDVGQSGFAEQQQRIGLQEDVGAQRRQLAQQEIGAEMAQFQEEDPFSFAQKYLQTVFAAPTQQVTRTQDPSTFQELIGGLTAVSGFMPARKEGGVVERNEGGSLASLLAEKEAAELDADIAEINEAIESGFGDDKKQKRRGGDATDAMANMGSTQLAPTGTAESSQRQAALAQLNKMVNRQNGGGISSLQVGGSPFRTKNPFPVFRPDKEKKDTATSPMRRILDNVKEGAKSVGRGIKQGAMYYSNELDPFRSYDPMDRLKIGLSILAAQPELGESPLTTVARGATAGTALADAAQLERDKLKAARRKAELEAQEEPEVLPNTVYDNIVDKVAERWNATITRDPNTGRITGYKGKGLDTYGQEKITDAITKAVSKAEEIYQTQPLSQFYREFGKVEKDFSPIP